MKQLLLLIAFIFTCIPPALAQKKIDYSNFEMLPILHEGRVKPLDSFARIVLKDLSGADTIGDQPAITWLAETIFDPAAAVEKPIFAVRDPAVKSLLKLKDAPLYTLQDILSALAASQAHFADLNGKDVSTLTATQQELLRLESETIRYQYLLRSLSLLLPLNIQTANATPPTYLDLQQQPALLKEVQDIAARKGDALDLYTPEEKQKANLAFSLQQIQSAGENSDELRVIPVSANVTDAQPWAAPWTIIQRGWGSPETSEHFKLWQDMATTYREKNAAAFTAAAQTLHTLAQSHVSAQHPRLEHLYNILKPFDWAALLYALSLALVIWSLTSANTMTTRAAFITMTISASLHAFGIIARILVLQRPPVGTLYESVLFVGLLCALLTLVLFIRNRNALFLLAGSLCAGFLLLIAPSLLQRGESLEMLAAVLNTNFWLGTHVLCITTGYALCVLTSCLAQIWLMQLLRGTQNEKLQQNIMALAMAALLFTCVGTVLGGIWADQSWGRFWGWDPKENGALLIVLWLVWVQHSKTAGHLDAAGTMTALAFLNVIVALAWFGVNLLSVGLHSYGFTNGIAAALASFCIFQSIVIIALRTLTHTKTKSS